MQSTNVGWGAPQIHGELLKLGIEVSQAAVSKYMRHSGKPPSQTWQPFLENHVDCLTAIDFFTVPTATFRILYVFIVLRHDRRRVITSSIWWRAPLTHAIYMEWSGVQDRRTATR
jgi:hypothetical protein